jgi:hypothetical protein
MAGKREKRAFLEIERRAHDKASHARELVQSRERLSCLIGILKTRGGLSYGERKEAAYLVKSITRLKATLEKEGVLPATLSSTERLKQLLRTSNHKLPEHNFRSGGAGVFAPGNSTKFWK